jgi:hypothetical protein
MIHPDARLAPYEVPSPDQCLRWMKRVDTLTRPSGSATRTNGQVERAGEDAAWASLTRPTVARDRSVATVPRLEDCRPRSVFEAGGPGWSLALAETNWSRAAPQFYWGFR